MRHTGNIQNHTKAIRGLSISLLVFFTALSITISGVYALPPDKNFGGECDNAPEFLAISCCWTETDAEGIEIEYCQHCDIDTKTGDFTGCGEKSPAGKNDYCSTRPQLACPEGDIPQFEQDSPLTKDSPLTTPSDVKDLEEIQPSNTNLGSIVGNEGSEQSINELGNGNDFTDSSSQNNAANTEQTSNDESQNQSSQD